MPIPDKSVGINNHKCKLRPDQWSNKSYGEANAEREVKRSGAGREIVNKDKGIERGEGRRDRVRARGLMLIKNKL